ncbi:hypothetical protein [Streptomyces sp. NPDC059970]
MSVSVATVWRLLKRPAGHGRCRRAGLWNGTDRR